MRFIYVMTLLVALSGCDLASESTPVVPDTFNNPILSGYHPDPSITRVGDTYYLTNSTFEWFPALPIHKSKDLVNWELVGYGINRPEQLNLHTGLKDSLGIFAPTIRHYQGKFYIITTCVGCGGNFFITADNAEGPWSDPIWVKGAVGIDPSLYWDEDGRSYYLGAGLLDKKDRGTWPGKNGVWMQEINLSSGQLLGESKQLTFGHASNARWAEGPHLYKIDDEYLLLIGEGGTNEYHAITVFNSKNLWGPYVANHANPVLTHRHLYDRYPITQTGHADLVQTQNGDWWSVMLAKRPKNGVTPLARETFLAKVEMTQQESGVTPLFNPGKGLLLETQKRPDLEWTPVLHPPLRDNFDGKSLSMQWNNLRTPTSKWFDMRDGQLNVMLTPNTISGLSDPAFLGKRIKHHDFVTTVKMTFESSKTNEIAGLALYRRSTNHYQFIKQKNELVVIKTDKYAHKGTLVTEEIARVSIDSDSVYLQIESKDNQLSFSYGESQSALRVLVDQQPLSVISDENNQRFNGTYIGVYASSNDQPSNNKAQFDWFEYEGL